MPRPKRTKVAPSAPAPRVRKPTKSATAELMLQAPRDEVEDLYDISDPDEGAVTSVRHVKRSNGKGRALPPLQMQSRVGNATPRTIDSHNMRKEAQYGVEKENDSPAIPGERTLLENIDLDSSSPEAGRRDRSLNTAENSILSIGNFKRRPRQPSLLGRAAIRARSSSVESNLAEDTGLSSVGRGNTSAHGIGKFGRRQREPSLVGRNGRMRSSSIGLDINRRTSVVGSAMKLETSKRRARELSMLGAAQKTQTQRAAFDDDDEEDFNPEDESTPLNLSKTRAAITTSSSAASSSNPRKRKLSSRQDPESSPRLPSLGRVEEMVPATAPLSDKAAEGSEDEISPEEVPMPSIEGRSETPEPFSATMAPPQSSSASPASPPLQRPAQRRQTQRSPSRGRRQLRSKTPLPLNKDSPPSSPPSLTHSPNPVPAKAAPTTRARKQPPPASTLSTAQLQALLPRRRRRGATRDPFDIASSEDEVDVSGLASDDDELTHSSVRAPPRRSTLNRLPAPLKKPSKAGAAAKAKAGEKKTYSRVNAISDKENEEHDPDDSLGPLPDEQGEEQTENSQEMEKRVGKELKRAAKKFKEVDEWKLDFEDNTASSSSPRDAR